ENKSMKLTLTLLLLALSSFTFASSGGNDEIPKILLRLQATHMPQENLVAVSFENAPGWHTYWKNPGDAGIPTKVEFKLNDRKIELTEREWPTPKRYIEAGDILAFGYSNQYHAFFELPQKLIEENSGEALTGEASWLICKHVCIPGKMSFTTKLEGEKLKFNVEGETFNVTTKQLTEALNNLPTKSEWPRELDIVLAANQEKTDLILFANYSADNETNLNTDQ